MHKNIFWYAIVILVVYFTLVFCDEAEDSAASEAQIPKNGYGISEGKELLVVEARTKKRLGFRHHHYWTALAIAYWLKVKVVIVSFFLGSAIFLGLRYYWPHKCTPEIVYDHPPPSYTSYSHHEHIPYSLDHSAHEHSYDSSSFEPYSGYSSSPDVLSSAPTAPEEIHRIGRRSVSNDQSTEEESRQMQTEEQIAEFMFTFLGLDSKACRRRFICEMEFRSKANPISSMAFRIVGRGFFEKYTNARNPNTRATSFLECAGANPECVFIENDVEEPEENAQENSTDAGEQTIEPEKENEIIPNSLENAELHETTAEIQNQHNLKAERHRPNLRRRRGDRKLDTIAAHILTKSQ